MIGYRWTLTVRKLGCKPIHLGVYYGWPEWWAVPAPGVEHIAAVLDTDTLKPCAEGVHFYPTLENAYDGSCAIIQYAEAGDFCLGEMWEIETIGDVVMPEPGWRIRGISPRKYRAKGVRYLRRIACLQTTGLEESKP